MFCILLQGPTCEENVNLCTHHPCAQNSTCVEEVGGYLCICPPGMTGEDCSDSIDFCGGEHPCINGGTCISGQEGYSCECLHGFQGIMMITIKIIMIQIYIVCACVFCLLLLLFFFLFFFLGGDLSSFCRGEHPIPVCIMVVLLCHLMYRRATHARFCLDTKLK